MEENARDPADSGIATVGSDRSEGRSVVIGPEAPGKRDLDTGGPNCEALVVLLLLSWLLGLNGSCIMLAHVKGAPRELPGPTGASSGSSIPGGALCPA